MIIRTFVRKTSIKTSVQKLVHQFDTIKTCLRTKVSKLSQFLPASLLRRDPCQLLFTCSQVGSHETRKRSPSTVLITVTIQVLFGSPINVIDGATGYLLLARRTTVNLIGIDGHLIQASRTVQQQTFQGLSHRTSFVVG